MVELECPSCHRVHWTIDSDFQGKWFVGESERPYEARQYNCPHCASGHTGFRVLRKAPPEFFLQPHSMYPMSVADFAFWLEICREAFPDHHKLRSLGVYWYPGSDHEQQERLRQTCEIGQVAEYRLFISNYSPDDERIEVGVQRPPRRSALLVRPHSHAERVLLRPPRRGGGCDGTSRGTARRRGARGVGAILPSRQRRACAVGLGAEPVTTGCARRDRRRPLSPRWREVVRASIRRMTRILTIVVLLRARPRGSSRASSTA